MRRVLLTWRWNLLDLLLFVIGQELEVVIKISFIAFVINENTNKWLGFKLRAPHYLKACL